MPPTSLSTEPPEVASTSAVDPTTNGDRAGEPAGAMEGEAGHEARCSSTDGCRVSPTEEEKREEEAGKIARPLPTEPALPSEAGPSPVGNVTGSRRPRVLLLEDDPAFRTVMHEFLVESGYAVHEAQNGVEGVKEIMEGDFSVILCDMLMPGLPGDLFFRAVERARPHLCDRFVFMTGHRGDATTNAFIEEVGAQALIKPFRLDELLGATREAEVRAQRSWPILSKRTKAEAGAVGRSINESPASRQADPVCAPAAVSTPCVVLRESDNSAMSPPARKSEGAVAAKRVLVLEDDAAFREVIHQFLTETGYEVCEAKNGIEGIKEVLAGDFAAVLCDMQMPALPGDLFYRAVQRARPELCERFIFMTGLRGDAIANDFIKSTNSRALLKPFNLNKLLEAIGAVERKRRIAKQDLLHQRPIHERPNWIDRTAEFPEPEPQAAPDRSADHPPLSAKSLFERLAEFLEACGNHPPARTWINVAMGLAMVAAAVMVFISHSRAVSRNAEVARQTQELEVTWEEASNIMIKARKDGQILKAFSARATRVNEDCRTPRWSAVLQKLMVLGTGSIQLSDIRVRHVGDRADAWTFRIAGRCAGNRLEADAFRRKIHQELQKAFPGVVSTSFEQLEEHSAASEGPAGGTSIGFTIVGRIGPASGQTVSPKPET